MPRIFLKNKLRGVIQKDVRNSKLLPFPVYNQIRYYLLVTCLTIGLGINAQHSYQLAEQDSLALVAFYWATDGPNWTSNQEGFGFDDLTSEWQERYDGQFNKWFDGPVKDWFGVRVEKRAIPDSKDSIDRVTWIWPVIGRRTDGQNKLKGYVPREVGLLTALEQFQVNGNDGFSWELLPDELYQPTLRHLDVEAAWFGGGLSDALRNCLGIRKLNTRYNYFDYIPNLDFLDEAALRNLEGTQWFYNARISYFYLERIIDHFYSVSPNLKEFGFEARDMFDVGDEVEIVAPIGSTVDLVCNDAGMREEFITYQWFKDGLSKFGKKDKTYTITDISESDYGHYTTRITNEYVKSYDQNGNYGEVFTKGYYLVSSPVPPIIERGVVSNNGQYIDLYFSKPMRSDGFGSLNINADSRQIPIVKSAVFGRLNKKVRISLETPIHIDEVVTLGYTGNQILDTNEGILGEIEALSIENRTRVAPKILSAETTLDGSGIFINLDQYMDASLLDLSSFIVEGNSTYTVASTTLAAGEIDNHISKTILLTLNESISDSSEVLTVEYLEGDVAGLYSGTLQPTGPITVANKVSVDRTGILFVFEDGSESLENILLVGSWKVEPIQMYDDGTQGDAIAGDHHWSYYASLVDDIYSWDVISRETQTVIDTIQSEDSLGNIVLTLMPRETNNDSLLSKNILLNLLVDDDGISGDSIYGIFNRDVIFNVKVNSGASEVYLMGINGDWSVGQLMTKIDNNSFTYTLPRKTAGDLLQYNYRIGNDWENVSPEPRNYLVVNGKNQILDEFGIFTSIEKNQILRIELFPNPTYDGLVHIQSDQPLDELNIYDSLGRKVLVTNKGIHDVLDLTNLPKGIYFLLGKSRNGIMYSQKFMIQ